MPSQQPEANAFITDHYRSMKTQAVQEHNRAHNVRKHEKVENPSLARMSTTKIIMIFKTKNVSKLLGRLILATKLLNPGDEITENWRRNY